jgi:hypothetical protein
MNEDLVKQEFNTTKYNNIEEDIQENSTQDYNIREDMQEKQEDNIKMKKVKQFVIVKEYNGSFYPKKKTKREYTQKTILKEQLPKSERNSLSFLDAENEKNMKFVTLLDSDDNSELYSNEYETKDYPNINNFENIKKGAFISLLTIGGLFGAYTIIKNNGE